MVSGSIQKTTFPKLGEKLETGENPERNNGPKPLLDVEGLARVLNLATQTVYNLLSRNPQALPPRIALPTRKSLWRPEVVQAWLSSFSGGDPDEVRVKEAKIEMKGDGGRPRGPRNKKYRRA